MIDLFLLAALALASILNKNNMPAFVGYLLFVVYQFTLFDKHDATTNHLMYGLIFIPCVFFATIKQSYALLVYSAFQWIVAIDYFLYPKAHTILSIYYSQIQIILTFSLILSGFNREYNTYAGVDTYSKYYFSWLDNLWHIQTRTR